MAAEKLFENKIKKYLKDNGVYPFGTPSDKMSVPIRGYYEKRFANRMTKSGLPDLSITINGYSLEVEVKAIYGIPSKLQLFNIDLIRKSGSLGIIVYPDQWQELKLLIDDLLHRPDKCIWEEQRDFDRE